MNSSVIRVCKLALVAVLVGAALYLVYRCWRNYQTYTQTERTIREALNEALKARKIDPILVVDLPGASRIFGVPKEIKIKHNLFRTDDVAGRRPAGFVNGTFNRTTGVIEVDMQFIDGKRALGLKDQLPPIP